MMKNKIIFQQTTIKQTTCETLDLKTSRAYEAHEDSMKTTTTKLQTSKPTPLRVRRFLGLPGKCLAPAATGRFLNIPTTSRSYCTNFVPCLCS